MATWELTDGLLERYDFKLPYQGNLEVWRTKGTNVFRMSLGWKNDEFVWLLDATNVKDAKLEALRKMKRWFQACITEFDFELSAKE